MTFSTGSIVVRKSGLASFLVFTVALALGGGFSPSSPAGTPSSPIVTASENEILAQIIPDNTLGAESSVVTPTNINGLPTEQIDGGATRGANLFHSFEQFSVPTGSTAYFNNALDIQNIISRVTGSSISNIDGLLRANGTANLFLLNPNGIIFGPDATLSIGGSFLGSTASSLNFADGNQFSATAHSTTPLLTVNVPIGLQYGATTGGIQVQQSILQVQTGQTLALVGGDVRVESGEFGFLSALGGRIELGGLAGAGMVEIDGQQSAEAFRLTQLRFPDTVERADILLTNFAFVDVAAGGGGSIALNARNLSILGESRLRAGISPSLGTVDSQAGDITLNATGVMTINQSSEVLNQVEGRLGRAGDINVKAGQLFITDNSKLETWGRGEPGNISVQADSVSLTGHSEIVTTSLRLGDAGDILVQANDSVSLKDSLLASNSYSRRGTNAGNISVQANNSVSLKNSLLASNSGGEDERLSGNGGNIYIRARSVSVADGTEVTSRTFGTGKAGNIEVNATDFVEISGGVPFPRPEDDYSQSVYYSGLLTSTEATALGSGGELKVTTGTLRISDGANLTARSRSAFSGGDITINADVLEITGGGQIITSAFSSGDAGNINVNVTDRITISGSNPTFTALFNSVAAGLGEELAKSRVTSISPASGLYANAAEQSTGQGGDLRISTGQLNIGNGAQLSVSSIGSGDAGNLEVVADSVRLDNQAALSADTTAGQGNIFLNSQDLVLRHGSSITTNATGTATGGNITIDSDAIVALEDSDISANAQDARGGRVIINAQGIFRTEGSDITATSELGPEFSGTVEINTPDVDPSHGLTTLPAELVEASRLIAPGCAAVGENEFIVTGRGGLPPNPSDPLSSDTVWSDLRTLTRQAENIPSAETTNSTSSEPAPIVEAQGWEINDKGEVVLIANTPTVTLHIPWISRPACH